jgi:GT2 family glycosyltransferase
MAMRFSVLIPTYNRPGDLIACIDSISTQDLRPSQCVIVDDGDLAVSDLAAVRRRLGSIELTYYKKDHANVRRGLSESKNIGLKLASEDVVFIFDDDIVLESQFLSSIMQVWDTLDSERLMGVGGLITNARGRSGIEKLYNALFFLNASHSWDITPVGFQVWDEHIKERVKGFYVHGGLSSVRKSRALQFPFNTFRGGRTALEDVDFCLRAKNAGYYFYMEPRARALHNTSPVGRENMYLYGIKESSNRLEIFRNNASRSIRYRLWFFWSSVGWVLRQFLAGNFQKAAGMLVGLIVR